MIRDVRGRVFHPRGSGPLRLVSLVPSTTESLFALGRGTDLVGYTRFCVHPATRIRPELWIGGTKNPKISRIIKKDPDLVLANREENRQEDVDALEDAGIPVWVAEPRSVPEAIADLRAMSVLLGREERGKELVGRIEAELARTRAHGQKRHTRVAYLVWREPWMVAGQATFIAGLLREAGATVPFSGRYPEVTMEALRGIERIFLPTEPFPFTEKHREEFLKAGFDPSTVQLVDGELLSWHGVRLREGLPYLREIL